MKRLQRIFALVLAAALLLICGVESVLADETLQLSVKADFKYEEARKMLKMINKFRTGKDAWYLSEDNRTKVRVTGLSELEYDYGLESVAMQRAVEIAAYFSHTRPDGSGWGTAFPKGYSIKGENLVYGYGSVEKAFKALAEEDQKYAGQGHRRNMLRKECTRVGFGAVKVGNVMYWVQSFGSGGPRAAGVKRYKSNKVTASSELLLKSSREIEAEKEEFCLIVGESLVLPKVVIYSNSGAKLYLSGCNWKTADKKIVKVKGSKATGVKKGDTKLETAVGSKKVILPVTVSTKADAAVIGEIIEDYEPALAIDDYMIVMEEDECFAFEEEEAEE